MDKQLWYTGAPLDRLSHRRADESWLAERLGAGETRIVPVWRSQSLVHAAEERALMPTVAEAGDLLTAGRFVSLLGVRERIAYFSVDLSEHDDPYSHPIIGEHGAFEDLRKVGPALAQHEGSILAQARGLMHWHARHGFCGVCGAPTVVVQAGYQRTCTNPSCRAEHFPRTDPAVIMLVHKDDMCLLARSRRFAIAGMYSTLAGFVEPGESLEEAVAREVLEEVGIIVDPANVTYWASQPWPFPASLMLGFHARAETTEIVLDLEEMEDAKWMNRIQMENPEAYGVKFPRRDSIAYRLVRAWMEGDVQP
jgi:NAD+ diphosphatase